MNRTGHTGLGLLLYSPIAFVTITSGSIALFVLGFIITLMWVQAPDIDLLIPGLPHRGVTHTIPACLTAGLITSGVAGGVLTADVIPTNWHPVTATDPIWSLVVVGYSGGIAVIAVGSHLLGDALTPMGIQPFLPWSRRHYSLSVVRADNRLANGIVAVGGWLAVSGAVTIAVTGPFSGNILHSSRTNHGIHHNDVDNTTAHRGLSRTH